MHETSSNVRETDVLFVHDKLDPKLKPWHTYVVLTLPISFSVISWYNICYNINILQYEGPLRSCIRGKWKEDI